MSDKRVLTPKVASQKKRGESARLITDQMNLLKTVSAKNQKHTKHNQSKISESSRFREKDYQLAENQDDG